VIYFSGQLQDDLKNSPSTPVACNMEKRKKDEASVIRGNIALGAINMAGKLRHRRKRRRKLSKFERRYTALGPLLVPEQKRIDYVLVSKVKSLEEEKDEGEKAKLLRLQDLRTRFETELALQGFAMKEEIINNNRYKLLHCPFKRLCKEAELVKLEMPLKGVGHSCFNVLLFCPHNLSL